MLLEIGILISLAAALFLVLKNYPKTGEEVGARGGERKVRKFWKRLFHKRGDLESIQKEIKRGQDDVISPLDIVKAEEKYQETDPEITLMLMEAEKMFSENDYRGAEEKAIAAIMKDKKCAESYVIIGKIAHSRGEFSDAKDSYKTAIKCNPLYPEAYHGLGMIDVKSDNFTEAIENLQRAVNLDRSQPSWWSDLGRAYMEVRQFAKATKSFKKAASLDIDNKEYKDLASEAEDKQRSHALAFRKK